MVTLFALRVIVVVHVMSLVLEMCKDADAEHMSCYECSDRSA